MKYLKIIGLLVIVTFAYSCGTKCNDAACITAPPVMVLDIRDRFGRDLLNPLTPFHYDTARMKLINNTGLISFIKQGVSTPNKDRIKVVVNWSIGENSTYLKLSDADQDTLYTDYERTAKGCCANYQLMSFKYNKTAYADSVANRYFTIVK